MRWNCPHCTTLVNLDIDLEKTPKAYVRCGKCMGIALLQKKAAEREAAPNERDLAKGFMSARDALQEEQMNSQNSQSALLQDYMENHIPSDEMETGESSSSPPTVEAMMEMGGISGPIREFRAKTSLPRPPAFLLAATAPQHQPTTSIYGTFHVDNESDVKMARIKSILILLIAAAAFIGGIFLFIKGQRAMQESQIKIEKSLQKLSTPTEPAQSQSVARSIEATQPLRTSNDAIKLASAASIPQNRAPRARIRVIVPNAILRASPSTEAIALDRIPQNEVLTIQSFRGNWIQVEGRKNGWLRNDLVSMLGE